MDSTAFPHLTADLARVQELILPATDTGLEASRAVGHLMGGVPKLVRPTLTLLSSYLFAGTGPADDRVVEAAAAIELIHVGTMCHDDVMDEADARRGRDSVNTRWGNIVAIISGDYLLARGAELASTLGWTEAQVVSGTLRTLCNGQLAESLTLYDVDRTEAAYLEAITGKTATLLAAACRMGAIEAGATPEQQQALHDFGLHLGIAFQINDDVLDLLRSADELGKPAGHDIAEGVYTLPTLRALAGSAELRELLGAPAGPEVVEKARQLVLDSGTPAGCAADADAHVERALAAIRSTGAPADTIEALVDFGRGTLNAVGTGDARNAELFYSR